MYDGNKDNGKGQLRAYAKRHEIKPGDRFLWHFKDPYCTSGRLPKKCMYHGDGFSGDKILTVIAVKEGRNYFGSFVDYWLNESGEWDGTFNQISNKAYIINGVDAFKMERAEKEEK